MPSRKRFVAGLVIGVALSFSVFAADKQKKESAAKEPPKPSYELPQPATETLDYDAYGSIRTEALTHSHVMEYASALMDGIGPRLTGSPNLRRPMSGPATSSPPWVAATPTLRTGANSAWAGCS